MSKSIPTFEPSLLVSPNMYVHTHDQGKGLIATQKIAPGTRILIEKPLFNAPSTFYFSPSTSASDRAVKSHIDTLSAAEQASWALLSNYHPFATLKLNDVPTGDYIKTHYIGKFKTAGIPIALGARRQKADRHGVFPLLSWANHACFPNAHHAWNEKLDALTVYALEEINKGEQITISYAPGNVVDRGLMKRMYGFTCFCTWCAVTKDDLKSPARIALEEKHRRMHMLAAAVHGESDQGRAMKAAFEAVTGMFEEDVVDYRRGLLFADAFDVAVARGDAKRGRILGFLARRAYVACEGPESDAAERVWKALGELMRRVGDVDGDVEVGGKGKRKEKVGEGGEEEVPKEQLKAWIAKGQDEWHEENQASREQGSGLKWLFMGDIWPEETNE